MFWREGEDGWEMERNNDRTNTKTEGQKITGNEGKRTKLRISFRNFMLDFERALQKKII